MNGLTRSLFSVSAKGLTHNLHELFACSHYQSLRYYNVQLLGKCQFLGEQATCGGGSPCKAVNSDVVRKMFLPPDDGCTSKHNVDYYISTEAKYPYCKRKRRDGD